MAAVPTISDAEWEVMSVLWSASPLTANEVVDRLANRKTWSPRTVKTLLNRLVTKKALAFESQGNRYLYRPGVQRDQVVRGESRSFLDRVFGGAVGPMLTHFVNQSDLSPEEIEALQKLLADKGAQKSGRKGKNP
jgi:BlaI family penicillinase repressor